MIKVKRLLLCIIVLISLMGITSCTTHGKDNNAITIVTTLFPEYEFINAILEGQKEIGKSIDVILIVPYGTSAHSYDPSISDLITIKNADLFVYTSDEMEPWVSDLNLPKEKVLNIYDAMLTKFVGFEGLELLTTISDEHEHEHEHDEVNESFFDKILEWIEEKIETIFPHHHHEFDPHFWTNMLFAEYMVEVIYDALIKIIPDPDFNKQIAMRENADRYIAQLRIIDQDNYDIVSASKEENRTLYFGAPFAFYYFTKRYGLEYVLTYSTCSTEVDPSLITVLEVVKKMKANDVKVILTKELTSDDAAKSISSYTGAEILELHSGHNISASEAGKVTFLFIMYKNTDVLAKALGVDTNTIPKYHQERGGE